MKALVLFLVAVVWNVVQAKENAKELWTLDHSRNLKAERRLSSRSFKNRRLERVRDVSLFEFPMEVASLLEAGDKVSFQIPPSARSMRKASAARLAQPRPLQKSCELREGITGIPKKIAPELKIFTCFPSKFEELHLIINTEKENGIFGTLFDSERNSFYIDPAFEEGSTYTIYNTNSMTPDPTDFFNETVYHDELEEAESLMKRASNDKSTNLRRLQSQSAQPNVFRFRFAIVVAPETSADHGGTVASVSATFIAIMSRANGIFSRSLGMILELIDGFEAGFCFDRNSEPCASVKNTIEQGDKNSAFLETRGISPDRYDLGHSFHQSNTGGAAHYNVLCSSAPLYKAGGTSDFAWGSIDAFATGMFAHEIGHMLGAGHSMRDCGQYTWAINDRDAVEPGSGTTIMSYLGVCGGDYNLAVSRGPYFNNLSQQFMRDAIESKIDTEPNCGTVISTGRTLPTVKTPKKCIIPAGTKFLLQGDSTSTTDDNRFSSWDRIDAGRESVRDSNQGRFRSYKPVRFRERFFPNLHYLNFGGYSKAENLPTGKENMTFRFTERRDFHSSAGLDSFDENIMGDFVYSDTVVEMPDTGKLEITEPSTGAEIPFNAPFAVRWSPGDIPKLSPDGRIQILFAENTMTALGSPSSFDPENHLDALDWKVLIEVKASDKAACVILPEITSDLNSFDGNLMIKVSANQDSSARIDDASNCFAIDVLTGISLFEQPEEADESDETAPRRRLESCTLGTRPYVPPDPRVPLIALEDTIRFMVLLGLVAILVGSLVGYRKIRRKFSGERSFALEKYATTASKPKDEFPSGGLFGSISIGKKKKRGLSLTNEGFARQIKGDGAGFKSGKLDRYASSSPIGSLMSKSFSSKKKALVLDDDEVAVSEGPKLNVQSTSSNRVSRAFGLFSAAARPGWRKSRQREPRMYNNQPELRSWRTPQNASNPPSYSQNDSQAYSSPNPTSWKFQHKSKNSNAAAKPQASRNFGGKPKTNGVSHGRKPQTSQSSSFAAIRARFDTADI